MMKIQELQIITQQGVKIYETWSQHTEVDEIQELGCGSNFFIIKSKGKVVAEVRNCSVVVEYVRLGD